MPASIFNFKYFEIRQDKCAMKVGTDAMLLGSMTNPPQKGRILDIGTGTGILTLMLAQRTNAIIDAIEIEENAFIQATENVKSSSWNKKINIIHDAFQHFCMETKERYDFIICNPPFFEAPNTKKGRNRQLTFTEERANARFSKFLTQDELLDGVKNLLLEEGIFTIILPYRESIDLKEKAAKMGLNLHEIIYIKSQADKPVIRVIQSFGFKKLVIKEKEFIIYDSIGKYTQQYIETTKEYHAKSL